MGRTAGRGPAWALMMVLGLGCAGSANFTDADPRDAAAESSMVTDATPEGPVYSSYCYNGNKDPNETDFDCGGNCPPCALGKGCIMKSDCAKGDCVSFICTAPSTCSNGKRDGSETDVDCGGAACATCPAGKKCAAGSDCTSKTCTSGTCG